MEFAKKLSLLVNPKTVDALGLSMGDLEVKVQQFVEEMKKEGVEVTFGKVE